jgi:hypothetical protein
MSRVDCPYCSKIGSLYAERVIQGGAALTTYFCDACHREWDEREGDERRTLLRPRTRMPKTRHDTANEA